MILGFIGEPNDFERVKDGSSVKGATHISKMGDSSLRKAFYMPSLTAIRYNPVVSAFADNLEKRGKAKKSIVVACKRKLVHMA